MSAQDRARWDARYRGATAGAPAPELVAGADLLPSRGVALDLACGTGGNARFLAGRGLRVLAVDVSPVALRIAAAAGTPGATWAAMDLEQPALRRAAVADVVVCTSFLLRPLLPALPAWLRPGGVLVLATFHDGYRVHRPEFRAEWLLRRGEAGRLFPGLDTLQTGEDAHRAWIVARCPR